MFRNKKIKGARFKSGQSTVEYIVLAAAVILAVILFFSGGNNSIFGKKIANTYSSFTNEIDSKAYNLTSREVGGQQGGSTSSKIVNIATAGAFNKML